MTQFYNLFSLMCGCITNLLTHSSLSQPPFTYLKNKIIKQACLRKKNLSISTRIKLCQFFLVSLPRIALLQKKNYHINKVDFSVITDAITACTGSTTKIKNLRRGQSFFLKIEQLGLRDLVGTVGLVLKLQEQYKNNQNTYK